MAEHSTPQFSGWFAEWNELSGTLINPVLAEIWAGTADPAEVLPKLCEDVDAFLADARYTGEGVAPPAAEPGEPATITWGFWGSPEEKATHEKVAEAFMAENPNITVEIWHQPWGDYFTKLQTLWAAGDAESIPDVLFLFPVPSYAADGVLEPLDPFIEASGYDLSDYWPGVLDTTSFEGSVYGFPRDVAANVLYYNKDHFDEAGLTYPDDSWTWGELAAATEQLTKVEASGRVSRHALGMEGGKYYHWVLSNGGAILDDMFNPSRCALADPESIEAITFFADMMNNDEAMRDANLNQAGGDTAVFQGEQVSMIIQNASRVPSFNAAGMNYDVAPIPFAPGGEHVAAGGGAAWTMSSFSDNKEEAWKFIEFLQAADGGQAVYVGSGEIMPPTRSAAESDAFLASGQPPENRQAFITMAEHSTPQFSGWFAEWNELSGTLINPILAEIWAGTANPADALPKLCEDVDGFLENAGYPR
jgi:multiple sugar transport system substrate-binding protein